MAFNFSKCKLYFMWLELRFSNTFQHMLTSFAEIQSTNLFDFLDLKLLGSCSNLEFNTLSKITQKALHVVEYGHASVCGHACYLWAQASSALALFPDVFLRRAISFLLHLQDTWDPLPSQTTVKTLCALWKIHEDSEAPAGVPTKPHWNNCKYFALTRSESRPGSMGGTSQGYHAALQRTALKKK